MSLYNANRTRLEKLIHRVFGPAQLVATSSTSTMRKIGSQVRPPVVAANRNVLHKIGVTGFGNAKRCGARRWCRWPGRLLRSRLQKAARRSAPAAQTEYSREARCHISTIAVGAVGAKVRMSPSDKFGYHTLLA